MKPVFTATRRWPPLVGPVVAVVLVLGAALAASGASRGLPAGPGTTPQSTTADCRSVATIISAAGIATSSTGNSSAVTAARGNATRLADATASDGIRELTQNLADDLAAYRTALSTVSDTSAERHTDISAAIHGDITALRMLCGG